MLREKAILKIVGIFFCFAIIPAIVFGVNNKDNSKKAEPAIIAENTSVTETKTPEIKPEVKTAEFKEEPKTETPSSKVPVPAKSTPIKKASTPAPKTTTTVTTPKTQTVQTQTPTPTPAPTPQQETFNCDLGGFSQQFLCLINEHRVANGKGKLIYNSTLNAVATKHSQWMDENNTMSHVGENGSTFIQRCQAMGISCLAENVAYGFSSAKHLFELWKNSPSHNKNMLGPYTQIGLGVSGLYATTNFK